MRIELKNYIAEHILPQYEHNIGGHDLAHVQQVIERSFELNNEFNLQLDEEMIFVIAAYHDVRYKENPDNHELLSAEYFLNDEIIKKFFSAEQIRTMYEAIIDHRASLEYEARSTYGKLVSSADREISVENMLKRSILFQSDKHKDENPTIDKIIDYSYAKLFSKYGTKGYAKMYFEDSKYLDFLAEMNKLLNNKELFVEREKQLVKEMQ